MGRIANITIEYYTDNFDLEKIYNTFLSLNSIKFFDNNYCLVDFEPVSYNMNPTKTIKDILLDAIKLYKDKPLVFSVIFDDIITHHTINATKCEEINISISNPIFVKGLNVPDFSYYLTKLIPYFNLFEIQNIKCSFG